MSKVKALWGGVSSYADNLSSSIGSMSKSKAAVIGGAIGAGYTAYDQGNISGAVTPNGIINAGIGAGAMLATRKFGTSIYSHVDDKIMRSGLSNSGWNAAETSANAQYKSHLNGRASSAKFEAQSFNKKPGQGFKDAGIGSNGVMQFNHGAFMDVGNNNMYDHQLRKFDFEGLYNKQKVKDDLIGL